MQFVALLLALVLWLSSVLKRTESSSTQSVRINRIDLISTVERLTHSHIASIFQSKRVEDVFLLQLYQRLSVVESKSLLQMSDRSIDAIEFNTAFYEVTQRVSLSCMLLFFRVSSFLAGKFTSLSYFLLHSTKRIISRTSSTSCNITITRSYSALSLFFIKFNSSKTISSLEISIKISLSYSLSSLTKFISKISSSFRNVITSSFIDLSQLSLRSTLSETFFIEYSRSDEKHSNNHANNTTNATRSVSTFASIAKCSRISALRVICSSILINVFLLL